MAQDEASYELKKPARMLLKQKFGSDYIGQLDWRDMWVHVVQKGRSNSLCEQLSRNPDLQNWAPPLAVTCLVPLTPELEGLIIDSISFCRCWWWRHSVYLLHTTHTKKAIMFYHGIYYPGRVLGHFQIVLNAYSTVVINIFSPYGITAV